MSTEWHFLRISLCVSLQRIKIQYSRKTFCTHYEISITYSNFVSLSNKYNSTLSLKFYKHIRVLNVSLALSPLLSISPSRKKKEKKEDQYLTYKFSITVSGDLYNVRSMLI